MKEKKKDILWRICCEGHTDAWVTADTWEQATVKAAEFWDVPWGLVAAHCVEKSRTVGAPRNICCRCGRTYYGGPPMCDACRKAAKLEEEETQRRMNLAYRQGRAM